VLNWKLKPEEMKKMSLGRDLKAANYKVVDKKTGEIELNYEYSYSGTLEFYFETGMEGLSSNVHDDRGWHESPSWNNDTQKNDGPVEKYKSLEWSVFLKGGEYLTILDKEEKIIWEGLLLRDTEACAAKGYRHHFLPQRIPYEDWVKWCKEEYRAVVDTNEPVLAEQEDYIANYKKQEDSNLLKGDNDE